MTNDTRRKLWRWPVIRDCLLAGWTTLRMPGRSHRGPLPPADEQLVLLATELRRHVVQLAEEIGERNLQRRPRQLAQAAEYIEAGLAAVGYEVKRHGYPHYHTPEDTVDKIDFERIARVVRGLRGVVSALVNKSK